jgi:hypothetical protein
MIFTSPHKTTQKRHPEIYRQTSVVVQFEFLRGMIQKLNFTPNSPMRG